MSDRARAPGPTTAERMSTMKANIGRERTNDKSKGVRLRYDMPNNLAKTSLAEGGFDREREAVRGSIRGVTVKMTTAPQVSFRQPTDDTAHLMNVLETWLNFETEAGAASMGYGPLKYVATRPGSDPLQGYLATSTCKSLHRSRSAVSSRCPPPRAGRMREDTARRERGRE